MHKECANFIQLHQYLDRYYQQVSTSKINEKSVLIAEQLATQLAKLIKQQPRLACSQMSLTLPHHQIATQLAFKQSVLLAMIAKSEHWPAWVLEELIACNIFRLTALAWFNAKQGALSSSQRQALNLNSGQATLKIIGVDFQHRYWPELLKQSSIEPKQNYSNDSSAYAEALRCCALLSEAVLPSLNKTTPGLEFILQQWMIKPERTWLLPWLKILAKSGPSLWLLGRFCSDTIGELALIVRQDQHLFGHSFVMPDKKIHPVVTEITASSLKLLPPRLLPDLNWLDLFVSNSSTDADPVHENLVSIPHLHEFNQHGSVKQQVNWLELHPLFAEEVIRFASRQSRQQISIQKLSHAVALVGSDNLPKILRLAWLQQQIEQCHQFYHGWFIQLELCFATALQVIAKHTEKIKLHPLDAQLLAGCVSLVLQQDERCRFLTLQSQAGSPLLQFVLQSTWSQADFLSQVSKTAATVELGLLWQDAVLSFNRPISLEHQYSQQQCAQITLLLAWQLCSTIFSGNAVSAPLENLLKVAQFALDLPVHPQHYWHESVLDIAQTYCPFPLDGIYS